MLRSWFAVTNGDGRRRQIASDILDGRALTHRSSRPLRHTTNGSNWRASEETSIEKQPPNHRSSAIGLAQRACDAIARLPRWTSTASREEIRLDERQLSQDLGVSRTPIREALSVLEQEGFVRSVPRRGIIVVRKSKREIVEMITVWAAIESMAARLAATRATDAEIAGLRELLAAFDDDPSGQISEYSDANMAFHKAIIRLGGIGLMTSLTDTLFIHMRAVRAVTMTQDNRARRSVADHRAIIAALEARDPDRAERLVREHTMGLAAHVERHGDFLDASAGEPSSRTAAERRRQYA